MKRLLLGVDGVADVQVKENKANKLDNAVTATFDSKKTSREMMAAKVRAVWDIDWYECPCGKTAPVAGKC